MLVLAIMTFILLIAIFCFGGCHQFTYFIDVIYTYALLLLFQEKLYQRILRQQEEGSQVTTIDIVAYLQVSLINPHLVILSHAFAVLIHR